jgi:GNAT superfamily N-acetyltransferase
MESIDLYATYLEELGAKSLIKNDKGFAIYSFAEDYLYIEEIYILPQYRGKKEFAELSNSLMEIAKQKGCKRLLGSVVPSINNSTRSLAMMISYGAKLVSSSNNFIVFEKEII